MTADSVFDCVNSLDLNSPKDSKKMELERKKRGEFDDQNETAYEIEEAQERSRREEITSMDGLEFIHDIFNKIKIYRNGYGMSLRQNSEDEEVYFSELVTQVQKFNLIDVDLKAGIDVISSDSSRLLINPHDFCVVCGLCKYNLIEIVKKYSVDKAHYDLSQIDYCSAPLSAWPHIIFREIVKRTGPTKMRQKEKKDTIKEFTENYHSVLAESARGVDFTGNHTEPQKQIEHKKDFKPTDEEKQKGKKAFAEMRRINKTAS